jgi:hypothetical protein
MNNNIPDGVLHMTLMTKAEDAGLFSLWDSQEEALAAVAWGGEEYLRLELTPEQRAQLEAFRQEALR